ncbi:MAG: GtrA family protein [Terriglobales bacterium]
MERTFVRFLKFNAVGGMGILVQLGALAILKSSLHLDYLPATALAVEAAVLHNFVWHERFTWADRLRENSLRRFVKFNLTTGMFSITGNLLIMKWLIESLKMQYLLANAIAIVLCSIVNFVVSDRAVFRAPRSESQPSI